MGVFVSYSIRDKDVVRRLSQDLGDAEEQVWLDQRLAGRDAWWRAILEQIRGCDVFIFALSQNSIRSKPCQAQLRYAQDLGLPILPVQVGFVDSIQLSPLAAIDSVDYQISTPAAAMRLVSALHRVRAQRQPLPEPLPDEPPVPFGYLIRLHDAISRTLRQPARSGGSARPAPVRPPRRRRRGRCPQGHRRALDQAARPRRRHLANPNRRRCHSGLHPRPGRQGTPPYADWSTSGRSRRPCVSPAENKAGETAWSKRREEEEGC